MRMTLLADDNGRYLGVLVEGRGGFSLPRPFSPSFPRREKKDLIVREEDCEGRRRGGTLLKATLSPRPLLPATRDFRNLPSPRKGSV